MLRSRRFRRVLAVAGLVGLVALGSCWVLPVSLDGNRARLTRLELPHFSSMDCPGSGAASTSGPSVRFITEWLVEADAVQVLNSFIRQGWQPITRMASDIKLLPGHSIVGELGLVQVRIMRGVSLSYADPQSTRVVLPTSVVFCPR